MTTLAEMRSMVLSGIRWNLTVLAVGLGIFFASAALLRAAEDRQPGDRQGDFKDNPCTVLADKRLEKPVRAIVAEYNRRTGSRVIVRVVPAAEVSDLVEKSRAGCDVVLCMAEKAEKTAARPSVGHGTCPADGMLPGAKKVAWKHPSGEPVWAAALTRHPDAPDVFRFFGGPTGHRLWAESEAGFRIASGKTRAEAYEWVVEHRTKHTYAMTAMRMLRECGGVRDGICIDVGCGSGYLDIELAKRSDFTVIGLDIDPDVKPQFEKNIRKARLEKRISFVLGDAQKMPFPDNYADVIFSRGTLIFIPDINKCLKEVDRVLKPTGVAFLGGRYVFTPQTYKKSTEELKKIVRESGLPGAQVIDARGQWVKIVGPKAPKGAHQFQGSPQMLAGRFVADYAITEGKCLLICGSDGGLQQGLQSGFANVTDLEIIALYPSEKVAKQAAKRIREAKLTSRITCKVGDIHTLPFEESSFDLVAGVGPVLIWQKDKEKAIREIYRVLRPGGAALLGGRYLYMPARRRVSSETLRRSAARTGIPSIRIIDDMGQWVEVRKGIKDRSFRD